MSVQLIVGLVIASGLLAVPAYSLTEYAGKMVHDPSTQHKLPWWIVRCISGAYSMVCVVTWGIFAMFGLMALVAVGVHGDRFKKMMRDSPEMWWLLQPLVPFIGPPMLVIAVVIKLFRIPARVIQTI